MNRAAWSLVAAAVGTLFYVSCGGSVGDQTGGDAGSDGTSPSTGGGSGNNFGGGGGACGAPYEPCCSDGTCESGLTCSGGVCLGASGGTGGNGGGSSGDDGSGSVLDGSSVGGGPVDAGYYYGDGSFWVDGGAYPPPSDASTGGADAATLDASPGCQPLAACCASLSGGLQSLCETIAESGNASNCATEFGQLQAAGNCNGVTVLASQVQVPANLMVSDGTLLFFTTNSTPGLLAMPVGGGEITVLVEGPFNNDYGNVDNASVFLAVDDVNVYLLENHGLVRIPKSGGAPTLVNEEGAVLMAATALGGTAYWLESAVVSNYGAPNASVAVESAPLQGGPISLIAQFDYPGPPPNEIAVTSGTVFVGELTVALFDFPKSTGVSSSGPTAVTSAGAMFSSCTAISSDTNAIYCAEANGSNLAIADDGTAASLGAAVTSSLIAFDDTYAYWVDMTTVGTIVKAPKAGGGNTVVLAYDTSPTAIAVDANSVYWADQGGFIKSVPK